MNIIFKKIELHNFSSFADTSLDLSGMGFTLVNGRNHCKLDEAYSNGSGKSSIFNGICFALTGETLQGITKGFENLYTDPNDCWVALEFDLDGKEFRVVRIKTPHPNLKVYVNGEDKSGKGIKESTVVLNSYLPDVSPNLIGNIMLLGQGLPHKFTASNPGVRKALLEELTKSDYMIQMIKNKLDARKLELDIKLRQNQDKSLEIASQIKVYTDQLNQYLKDEETWLSATKEYGDLREYSDKLEAELRNIETNLNSDNVKELELKLESLNETKLRLVSELDTKIKIETKPLNENLNNLVSSQQEIKSEISVLKREIKKLKSITDICPTCGQKLVGVEKPDYSSHEHKLTEWEDKNLSITCDISKLQGEISNMVDDIRAKTDYEINSVDSSISELKLKIKSTKEAKDKLLADKISKTTTKLHIDSLLKNGSKLEDNIKELEKTISELNSENSVYKVAISDIEARQVINSRMITLSKKEFRNIILSNVIKQLDSKAKQYALKVFGNARLSIESNENLIDVMYCGKLYENLSGGEKQKVDIIIQLALRDIVCKHLNLNSNLIVLDEIYDNLDVVSCRRLTNLIMDLTDIASVFIISHHTQDLEITYDNSILVEKSEEGISSIKFV